MIKKHYVFLIVALVAIAVSSFQYSKHRHDPVIGDEAAIIFSSVYWNHLIHGEFRHADWRSSDAAVFPPLAKYYYGAVLSLRGLAEKTAADKDWWFENSVKDSDPKGFEDGLRERLSQDALITARAGAAIIFVMLILSAYALGFAAGGVRAGALAAAALLTNGIILGLSSYAYSEGILAALAAFQTALLIIWARRSIEADGRGGWGVAIASGLLLALAALTKVDGAVQFIVTAIAATSAIALCARRLACFIQSAAMIAIAAAAVFILNPAFMNSQGALAQMLSTTPHEMAPVITASVAAGMSLFARCIFALRIIFIERGWLNELLLPLMLSLALGGSVLGLRSCFGAAKLWRRAASITIAIASMLWGIATLRNFNHTLYARHLIPLMPWICLAIGIGANRAIDLAKANSTKQAWDVIKGTRKTAWILGALFVLLAWRLVASPGVVNSYNAMMDRPAFRAEQMARILEVNPANKGIRSGLVMQYVALGRDADASAALKPLLNSGDQGDAFADALYRVLRERSLLSRRK